MKFIDDNNISVQAIFDKALDELGHTSPAPEEIDSIARKYAERRLRRDIRRNKR